MCPMQPDDVRDAVDGEHRQFPSEARNRFSETLRQPLALDFTTSELERGEGFPFPVATLSTPCS